MVRPAQLVKRVALSALALGAGGFLSLVFLGNRVREGVSPIWHGSSTLEARKRGSLRAAPLLLDSTLRWRQEEVRVTDAWIEEQVQQVYRLGFFRHDVPLGRYRLYWTLARADVPYHLLGGSDTTLGFNDTIALSGESCSASACEFFARVTRPFPDTLRFTLVVSPPRP